jgi:predicted RNase H-like nuclease (RuvC/YqgF family)
LECEASLILLSQICIFRSWTPIMKFNQEKEREKLQSLLEHEQHLENDIEQIEKQIEELEVQYLEKSWPDGNIYIGWNKNLVGSQQAYNKLSIAPHEKYFTRSSITSNVHHALENIADKNISPWGENRFESM